MFLYKKFKNLFYFNNYRIHKYNIYENKNRYFELKNLLIDKDFKMIILQNNSELKVLQEKLILKNSIDELKKGFLNKAIAFCIINKGLIIHITWLARNELAKKYVDIWQKNINWTNTAVWGNAFTMPEYRKNGLYSFTHKYIQTYLFKKDIKYNRFSIKKINISSINAMNKFNPNILALGINIKIYIFNFRFTITKAKKND